MGPGIFSDYAERLEQTSGVDPGPGMEFRNNDQRVTTRWSDDSGMISTIL